MRLKMPCISILFLLVVSLAHLCALVESSSSNTGSYTGYTLDQISLNRVAARLAASSTNIAKFPNFDLGFTWNDEDQDTTKWRPQGLTGITTSSSKEFAAISRDELSGQKK